MSTMEALRTTNPEEGNDHTDQRVADVDEIAHLDFTPGNPDQDSIDHLDFEPGNPDLDSIDHLDFPTPNFEQEDQEQSHSSLIGNLIRSGAQRIEQLAGFFDERAATSGERREARKDGRAALRKIGGNALRDVMITGAVVFEVSSTVIENGAATLRQKVITLAKTAKRRAAVREHNRYIRDWNAAEDMNRIFPAQVEAQRINTEYDQEVEARAMNMEMDHAEALNDNNEFDLEVAREAQMEAEREIMLKAERAKMRKAERRATRIKMQDYAKNYAREKGSALWEKTKSSGSRFGRAAMSAFKKVKQTVGRAANAVATGVKTGVAATAQDWRG